MEKFTNQKSGQETPRKGYVIKTQFSPNYTGRKADIQGGISQTVPDQSLSIRQLLDQHSRGIGIKQNAAEAQYFNDEIPVFLDMTDREAYRDALLDRHKEITDQLKKEQDERDKAAQKLRDERKAEFEKWKKENPQSAEQQ